MLLPLLHAAIAVLLLPLAAWGQQITLPSGATITGTITTNAAGNEVHVFRGIRYAESPVGARRWKPATLAPLTSRDLNATDFGDACLSNPESDGPQHVAARSEDCLFLNVYAPAGATPSSKFPVMVWTHGGRFVGGSGNVFDGSNLIGAANNEMVYVSINYRLGVMGFFSNDQQREEGVGGNFGLRDQEVAYEWIQQHIRHFGGNPSDVTAFGESAGAMSIALHLVARDGKQQHFHKAIMQSGSITPFFAAMLSSAKAAAFTALLAENVGCSAVQDGDLMSCLRAVDGAKIMEAAGLLAWLPSVDGVFLTDAPVRLMHAGHFSRVPNIIGTNTDEGWIFSFGAKDEADFVPFVLSFFPKLDDDEVHHMQTLYPVAAFASPHLRAAHVLADAIFDCPSEKLSLALSAAGASTFRYRFAQKVERFGPPMAVHTAEIPYVFNGAEGVSPAEADAALVATIQAHWVSFAKTGSPNGYRALNKPAAAHSWLSWLSSLSPFLDQQRVQVQTSVEGVVSPSSLSSSSPEWPRFDPFFQQQLVLQTNATVEASGASVRMHKERCAFWSRVDERVAWSSELVQQSPRQSQQMASPLVEVDRE